MSPLFLRLLFRVTSTPSRIGTRVVVTPRWFTPQWLVLGLARKIVAEPAVKSMRVSGRLGTGEDVEGFEVKP